MHCAFCHTPLVYVHGHAACPDGRCPHFGRNQAECCGGETAHNCPVPTASVAGGARPVMAGGARPVMAGGARPVMAGASRAVTDRAALRRSSQD